MPELRMHLVIEHSDHFGSGVLYRKVVDTPFLPRKGDRVVLFAYDDEHAYDGPMGIVHEVYWATDGTVSLDMEHYVVDPSEQMEQQIRSSFSMSHPLHGWYTERDANLAELLERGGWTTRVPSR